MNNGPISVSAPGKSLIGATAQDVTFSTRYPFAKLDSTNENSFEVISLFFNTEPPDPATPTTTTTTSNTLVYKYAHGYTYTPSTWFLLSLNNFTNTLGPEGSIIEVAPGSNLSLTYATLNITVDDTYVYFYVYKQWWAKGGVIDPNPPHVIGLTVSIRAYIFVEDLLGGSVPTHA